MQPENGCPTSDLFEALSEIEEAAKPFQTFAEWFAHIEEYTNALKMRQQKREMDAPGVRLMTMHAAKGLEFDTVFIVQANEGRIPYKKSLKEMAKRKSADCLCGDDPCERRAEDHICKIKTERRKAFPFCR